MLNKTKPQYTLETWLWDAEAVSPKDGRRKPRLGGVALSQQGGGNFRALNVWFNFVPRVVGGVWHTGVSRTTCLWVNMLHSEPQADTQSYVKSSQNSIQPDSRDFLPQARGHFCLLRLPLVIANASFLSVWDSLPFTVALSNSLVCLT